MTEIKIDDSRIKKKHGMKQKIGIIEDNECVFIKFLFHIILILSWRVFSVVFYETELLYCLSVAEFREREGMVYGEGEEESKLQKIFACEIL